MEIQNLIVIASRAANPTDESAISIMMVLAGISVILGILAMSVISERRGNFAGCAALVLTVAVGGGVGYLQYQRDVIANPSLYTSHVTCNYVLKDKTTDKLVTHDTLVPRGPRTPCAAPGTAVMLLKTGDTSTFVQEFEIPN